MNAVIEAVEHDNTVHDADHAPEWDVRKVIDHERREALSVADAVTWANAKDCPVTLYLYDEGVGLEDQVHFEAVGNRF